MTMKISNPTLTEQDLAIIALGLDALVRAQGLQVTPEVARVLALLDAAVSETSGPKLVEDTA